MPEEGDTVRTAVAQGGARHEAGLAIAYEVRSISAMKNLVGRGAASAVLPYFAVIDEVRDGKLDARQIIEPSIRRTLYLATSSQRGPFRNADGLASAIRASLDDRDGRAGALGASALSRARAKSARSPQPILLDFAAPPRCDATTPRAMRRIRRHRCLESSGNRSRSPSSSR